MAEGAIVAASDDFIVVSFERCRWFDREEYQLVEEAYRIGGGIWRVNKYDADPLPSQPHAHCIEGRQNLVGCKLHLGSHPKVLQPEAE